MPHFTENHLLEILTAEANARGRKSANALVKSITGNSRIVPTLRRGGSCTIREANRLLRELGRPELVSVDPEHVPAELRPAGDEAEKEGAVG